MPLILLILIIVLAAVLIVMLGRQQWGRNETGRPSKERSPSAAQHSFLLPFSTEELPPVTDHPMSERVRLVSEAAAGQLASLRRIAARLADREVAAQLHALCVSSESIAGKLRLRPGGLTLVRRHYDYYLPTTVELLQQYDRLIHSPVYTKEMEFQVKRIENLLPSLRANFDKYVHKLMRHELIDIEVEVGTLEQVMRSERASG
ncbi:5-bromo-4-chloroindolyl phosphate hydrolysis family protein [Paenibacillus sp. 1P07SE]|uniref:5-bromo-4-chloroindolyl phosphate hydrolysis family protein n=1 Tax=Paenibacillus sp. 1P07SE TaxID=3132209 RepID=UPI0039A53EB6